jgi:opacity protein-like surface antigen
MKMDVRSIAIAGAVLVLSSVAGFAQDWTKNSQDWPTNSQGQTQSPVTPVQTPQATQPQVQPQIPQNQTPPAQNWTPTPPPQYQTQNSEEWAQKEWTQNLYSRLDFGGVFQQNATLDTTTSSGLSSVSTNGTETFNLGIRADIALGYNINKSLAAEFDTGLLWNSADKIGATTLSSINQSFDTYTIPILVNVTYKFPIKGPWSSYVGIGAGGAASILVYNNSIGSDMVDENFVFAYQAEAGLKYKLSENASVGVAYDFLGTTDPSWNLNQPIGLTTTSFHIKEKGFYTHSITLSFTWDF